MKVDSENTTFPLELLPIDLILQTFSNLDQQTIIIMMHICKRFYNLIYNDDVFLAKHAPVLSEIKKIKSIHSSREKKALYRVLKNLLEKEINDVKSLEKQIKSIVSRQKAIYTINSPSSTSLLAFKTKLYSQGYNYELKRLLDHPALPWNIAAIIALSVALVMFAVIIPMFGDRRNYRIYNALFWTLAFASLLAIGLTGTAIFVSVKEQNRNYIKLPITSMTPEHAAEWQELVKRSNFQLQNENIQTIEDIVPLINKQIDLNSNVGFAQEGEDLLKDLKEIRETKNALNPYIHVNKPKYSVYITAKLFITNHTYNNLKATNDNVSSIEKLDDLNNDIIDDDTVPLLMITRGY